MRQLIAAGLLAVTGLVAFAGTGHAGFFLRVPFVTVHVDRGVFVGAGPVRVVVPPAPVVVGPSQSPGVIVSQPAPAVRPVPEDQLPPPTPLPPAAPVPPAVVQAMTVEQFAAAFKPQPGKYEVVLIHPKSCQPVKVCFDLPPGCPRKVRVTKHVLEFDYGRDSVRIRFFHDGDVKVLY
jgi:hypothetical protein